MLIVGVITRKSISIIFQLKREQNLTLPNARVIYKVRKEI